MTKQHQKSQSDPSEIGRRGRKRQTIDFKMSEHERLKEQSKKKIEISK